MIRRLACPRIVKTITLASGVGKDRLPLAVAHQVGVHVKCRNGHVRRYRIAITIKRVPDREWTGLYARHPGGWIEGKDQVGVGAAAGDNLVVIPPVAATGQWGGDLNRVGRRWRRSAPYQRAIRKKFRDRSEEH